MKGSAMSAAAATRAGQAISTPRPSRAPRSALMQWPDCNYSVICLINEQRMMNGMKPLRPNGLLHDAAFIYVTSMLSGEFFTHHGGVAGTNNASTVIGRLRLLGYIPPGR